MNKRTKTIISMLILGLFFANQYVTAEAWNWQRPFKAPGKNIETLIITGNYRQPRIIAELIQNETHQPIIVLPTNGNDKAYFLTGDRSDTTMTIKKKDFSNFVKFSNPDKILVLGGNHYIPEDYLDLINPRQTVVRISNTYWLEVAKTIQNFFNLTYLVRDYKQQVELINSGRLYTPEKSDMPPAKIEENNIIINPISDKNSSYTPPPFEFKEDTAVEKTNIESVDIKIKEPTEQIKTKSKTKTKTSTVIPNEVEKEIDSKSPNEPKLIDEDQFLPK